jgi:hypothetical protein
MSADFLDKRFASGIGEQRMQNITFSADAGLIKAARERARHERTTLNDQFRRWLEDYVGAGGRGERAMALIDEMIARGVTTGGRKFTREEMNER